MALEIAHAYDDNKNLVPLYIVTDSDPVYEPTTPGFIINVDKPSDLSGAFRILITNSAMNPTGGELDVYNNTYSAYEGADMSQRTASVKVDNQSNFDIILNCGRITWYVSDTYRGAEFELVNVQLSPNSSTLVPAKESDFFSNYIHPNDVTFMKNLIIQRVL